MPRDEKGRFTRADNKPVLHRQVEEPTNMDGLPVPECWEHYPRDGREPLPLRHLLLLAVVLGLLIGAFAIGAEAML